MMAAAIANERSHRGITRVLAKLNHSLTTGNYYEAHQMYRTLYYRYTAQRKYKECLELLYNGAMKLVCCAQYSSAADLGLLVINTLANADKKDMEIWIHHICVLIESLSPTIIERENLINRSIKWTSELTANRYGDPNLHKRLASLFWSEGNMEQARYHLLFCRDGVLCGRYLAEISERKAYASEVDLFIVQAVLQQLCLDDRQTAEMTFLSYVNHHPKIKPKTLPYKEPLLNFLYFLFCCIDMNSSEVFSKLCELYQPSLNRDPSFEKYLNKIGVQVFNINIRLTNSSNDLVGGVFRDMFSHLLRGFDDEENGDEFSEYGGGGGVGGGGGGGGGGVGGVGSGGGSDTAHELD